MVPQRVEELMKCYWPGSAGETRDFYVYNVLKLLQPTRKFQMKNVIALHSINNYMIDMHT